MIDDHENTSANPFEPCHEKTRFLPMRKQVQISFAVTAKLISAFVFATRIERFLFFPYPKFQVSSHLLYLYSSICVRPGRKSRRPVFSHCGSFNLLPLPSQVCTVPLSLHAPHDMSHLVGKPTMWFPNRSDTNRPVQAQKRARSLKFWI